MTLWLLEDSVLNAMQSAPAPTAAQLAEVTAALGAGGSNGSPDRVMTVTDGVARIHVKGVMTSAPSFMAYYFGGGNTLYGDLMAAARTADADPAVKRVDFVINSGGGEAAPVIALGDTIAAMKTPTRAVAAYAASAAYWVASQADEIVAEGRGSSFGSIGVVRMMYKPSERSVVEVASTNAPNKRPDPETAEGQAVIKAELDEYHDLFATAVAVGRDKSVKTVNNDFGRGGMMLAAKALDVGMIDKIGDTATSGTKPTKTKTTTGATIMDLATLKREHPALVAQIETDARAEGAAAELDRVKFHIKMGQRTGAMDVASAACLNGIAKDDGDTTAEYLSAGMNKGNLADRAADETELADNNPAPATEEGKEQAFTSALFSGLVLEDGEG